MMSNATCPNCGEQQVVIEPFDFGVDTDTGYRDEGETFRCLACGETGPVEDLDAEIIALT